MREILLAGFLLFPLAAGCADTEEEICCGCLTEHGCITDSFDRCVEMFYVFEDKDSIPVDGRCVGSSDCYTSCAVAGAYFDGGRIVVDYWKNRIVVDYWKKKSLP